MFWYSQFERGGAGSAVGVQGGGDNIHTVYLSDREHHQTNIDTLILDLNNNTGKCSCSDDDDNVY